jgi:hypothetical protein
MMVAGRMAVVHPGQADADHVRACILPLALHIRHQTAIGVFAAGSDGRLLPVTQG